jgi:23S rRNA (pseudouridine1915-N3)-methyltransferase
VIVGRVAVRIRVVAVGRKMPDWVVQGCSEYEKRLPREIEVEWQEIAPGDRRGGIPAERAKAEEAEKILARLNADDWVVALDERGKSINTMGLAAQLSEWQMHGRAPVILIGGADGLARDLMGKAQQKWSLSALTFPHPLVRVLLSEQIYRAAMVNANHPYHRA